MIYYVYYNTQGKYVQSGTALEEVKQSDIPQDCQVYYGFVNIENQYHDIANNTPVTMPARPNYEYSFNYTTKLWELDVEQAKANALYKREQLLLESDWTDTLSAKNRLGETLYDQWQTYRQALRDITTQSGYPGNITWPTKPA
jgi:hypothetical protein